MSKIPQHPYFRDPFMDYAFQYTLGLQSQKGCELGECLYAASRIRDGDPSSWGSAWLDLARQVEAIARAAEGQGNRVSAREAYLRAFTYYRRRYGALRPSDPDFRDACEAFRSCFQKFAALSPTPIEMVQIPFEGKFLPGYFLSPDASGTPRPTLMIGDNFAEELYFWAGPAGISRGYNVLLTSLPGYGFTPFDRMYYRVDMDTSVTAVVDYLLTRKDVDPRRIAFYGAGEGGGYTATRVAACEKRVGASIANPPVCDTAEVLKSRLPQLLQKAPAFLKDALMKRAAQRQTLASIAIEQSVWATGETEQSRAFQLWDQMKVDPAQITIPVLCLAGAQDLKEVLRQTQVVFDAASHPKKGIHIFSAAEGADAFRQANNFSRQHQVLFDWLNEVFEYPEKRHERDPHP